MTEPTPNLIRRSTRVLEHFVFASRWIQLPLYLGLIAAQVTFAVHFGAELWHVMTDSGAMSEAQMILALLGLVDAVLVANLMAMVIIGGYETFVSKLDIEGHEDQPEWLGHVNAGVLKVKLATSLIGISSIHLLKSFLDADNVTQHAVLVQLGVHAMFIISAIALAYIDRLQHAGHK